MSENDFLSRWSRLKRAAAKPAPAAQEPPAAEETRRDRTPQPDERRVDLLPTDEVDLSALPSLDSIGDATDVTGFLQRGVPEELRRSALRKAWSSDPAIRDFVNPSENAWDFNDPNAIPGFGPIGFSPDRVQEMAKRLVGGIEEAAERIDGVSESAAAEPAEAGIVQADRQAASGDRGTNAASQQIVVNPAAVPAAAKPDAAKEEPGAAIPPRPRRHGGALPQ